MSSVAPFGVCDRLVVRRDVPAIRAVSSTFRPVECSFTKVHDPFTTSSAPDRGLSVPLTLNSFYRSPLEVFIFESTARRNRLSTCHDHGHLADHENCLFVHCGSKCGQPGLAVLKGVKAHPDPAEGEPLPSCQIRDGSSHNGIASPNEHNDTGNQSSAMQSGDYHCSQIPVASLSRMFLRGSGKIVNASVGVASSRGPAAASRMLRGPAGVAMALVLAAAGMTTVACSILNEHLSPKQREPCRHCEGEGLMRCDLCNGEGAIFWEGKHLHRSPCPACIGEGVRKCVRCGGARICI